MTNVTRRRRSIGDTGTVVVLPIVLLLAAAGVAALVGISLQPSDASTPSIAVVAGGTPTFAPVPAGPCPSTASIASPPAASDTAAHATWVSDTLSVLADRVQCTKTVDGITATGWGARPEFARYAGIDLDTDTSVLRVYWKGPVPTVVRDRVGKVPRGVKVAFVTTAKYTSDQIDGAVGALAPGNGYAAIPPIAGRAAGAPQLVITAIDAREDGSAIGVTYAYADGGIPSSGELAPAAVAKALETLTGGVTVVATPAAAAS